MSKPVQTKEGQVPAAKRSRTKKDADTGEATATKRRRKAKEVEEEVLEDAEDEDIEEAEAPSVRRRITPEIAQQAADMRAEGAKWTEIQEETGFNGAQLRPHIARLTEASIETLEDTPESVAEHRDEGYAWYAMAISLDKTIAEVKAMAVEGGSETEGRVYRSNGAEDVEDEADVDDEQDEDEDEDEEDEEPAPKRRSKPAASKPAPKRRKKASTPS